MRYTFKAEVWVWATEAAPASWRFATLPVDVSKAIRTLVPKTPGFGSVRVTATIGKTTWTTSLFPSKQHDAFLLPLKADVRKREKVADGDVVKCAVEIEF